METRTVAMISAILLLLGFARAATPIEEAWQAELDRVRAEVADQVQLAAYDLVDELVYGWTQDPVFETTTPVVLAGVTVPVGLGTGLEALLENHISAVLLQNPATRIKLVHCPRCTAVVVHSGRRARSSAAGWTTPRCWRSWAKTRANTPCSSTWRPKAASSCCGPA